jgi:Domain of unknown function (DUF4351)
MAQARMEGELMGEARGRRGEYELVLRLLKRRVGDISVDAEGMVKALSVERLEALGEALLDFTQVGDLMAWLERNK